VNNSSLVALNIIGPVRHKNTKSQKFKVLDFSVYRCIDFSVNDWQFEEDVSIVSIHSFVLVKEAASLCLQSSVMSVSRCR